jgi:hypothetical protein
MGFLRNESLAGYQWLKPVIVATLEVEIRKTAV